MSGENLQKKNSSITKLQTCGTAPKIQTLVAKYTSQKKTSRSEFGPVFLFFCWKLGEDGVFVPKKSEKDLATFWCFFCFGDFLRSVFGDISSWYHGWMRKIWYVYLIWAQQNQQKDLWPFRKWSTKFAKFLWLCQNLDRKNLCFLPFFKLRSVFKTDKRERNSRSGGSPSSNRLKTLEMTKGPALRHVWPWVMSCQLSQKWPIKNPMPIHISLGKTLGPFAIGLDQWSVAVWLDSKRLALLWPSQNAGLFESLLEGRIDSVKSWNCLWLKIRKNNQRNHFSIHWGVQLIPPSIIGESL